MADTGKIPADGSARCSPAHESARSLGNVVGNGALGGMTLLSVRVPGWRRAKPGQFALLQAQESAVFFGRALSVSRQSGETVSFLVAPVGRGTRELCDLRRQSPVWVLGPLGNHFDPGVLMSGPGRAILVGGGVGIAPLPLLVEAMAEGTDDDESKGALHGTEVLVLAGFRDSVQARGGEVLEDAVAVAARKGLSCLYERVVEEATAGSGERVTDLLARHLRPGDRVAVCGPEAMASAVWQMCSSVPDVMSWFSLEANMACGVGSCHGCVIALADGSYARVCREGPVFAGEEVFGG